MFYKKKDTRKKMKKNKQIPKEMKEKGALITQIVQLFYTLHLIVEDYKFHDGTDVHTISYDDILCIFPLSLNRKINKEFDSYLINTLLPIEDLEDLSPNEYHSLYRNAMLHVKNKFKKHDKYTKELEDEVNNYPNN